MIDEQPFLEELAITTQHSDRSAGSVETEHVTQCPNCTSTNTTFWVNGRDRLLGLSEQVFAYSKCRACGVIFQSLRPTENAISTFYAEGYRPHGGGASELMRRLPKRLNRVALRLADRIVGAPAFRDELNRFYKALVDKPRFLDFGCGAGKFLDRARKFGCDTIGMDFSPIAVAEVARRGHRALSITEADWDAIENGTVGMVRMNHVLEHLYDPASALRRLHAKMAPGAALHLATPNADSLTAADYAEHWFSLDCPRHIIIHSPESLRDLLERTGFSEVRVLQEPVIKDLTRSWAYREIDAGRRSFQEVALLADDGWLNLQFSFAARNAVRKGRSDRIHAFATKR